MFDLSPCQNWLGGSLIYTTELPPVHLKITDTKRQECLGWSLHPVRFARAFPNGSSVCKPTSVGSSVGICGNGCLKEGFQQACREHSLLRHSDCIKLVPSRVDCLVDAFEIGNFCIFSIHGNQELTLDGLRLHSLRRQPQ